MSAISQGFGRKLLQFAVGPVSACWLLAGSVAWGGTYYVDFVGGKNDADGTSPQTAWKHSPGDKNATDTPKATKLQAGDTVIFKGGVGYHGEIEVNVAGEEGKPITLDGNTEGKFGEGRAILDGARMINNWQAVKAAEDVDGNPKWNQIMYTDLDMDLTTNFNQDAFVTHRDAGVAKQAPWQRLFLIDGTRRILPIAQLPKPSDPFYPDIPSDFYLSPHRLTDNYPHKVFYEPGSQGNSTLPVLAITYGGSAPVIQPFNGGAVSVEMNESAKISEIGFTLFRPKTTPVPEHIAFLVDGKEIFKAPVDKEKADMQRFKLPEPVEAKKLTFRLEHSNPGDTKWTKLQQIAAFTADGTNVILHKISTAIKDEERLVQKDPKWYDGMFVGAHGGNNHVYFARAREYDPNTHTLLVPHFQNTIYNTTRYALYNSPRFIEQSGEWCLMPLEGGKTRVFLLPEELKDGQPQNIGYPVLGTGIMISGPAAHVQVKGFLIQRYTGGSGAIATRQRQGRPNNIVIVDCEVRFISGQSGISLNHSDNVVVERNFIHQCPGWTVGMYVNRTNNYKVNNNRLDKNSGSGIRHYESTKGELRNNVVLNHFGMHSSGLNFYEGCADIVFENNYVHNTIAVNRNAERITFHNNVIDGLGRASVGVAMWTSGRTGGTAMKDIHFTNNTFVNMDKDSKWAAGIFGQRANSPSKPAGLVIKNNILHGLGEDISGQIENNIYTKKVEDRFMGDGCTVVEDLNALFQDPAKGDFRRKPGGPLMEAGATVPPPANLTTR